MISLEIISDDNRKYYKKFETIFSNDLFNYQSRIYPNINTNNLWYYIKYDSKYIGACWLEIEKPNDNYATLGIFIAYDEYRNIGIGKRAIKMLIENAIKFNIKEIKLHVRENNIRAKLCYRHIGFFETRKFIKSNGQAVIEMIYML